MSGVGVAGECGYCSKRAIGREVDGYGLPICQDHKDQFEREARMWEERENREAPTVPDWVAERDRLMLWAQQQTLVSEPNQTGPQMDLFEGVGL